MQQWPCICRVGYSSATECHAGLFKEQIWKIQVMQTGLKRHKECKFSSAKTWKTSEEVVLRPVSCICGERNPNTETLEIRKAATAAQRSNQENAVPLEFKNEGKKEFMVYCAIMKLWFMVFVWGLQVWDLQWKHYSRCGRRFLWGVKWTVIPTAQTLLLLLGEEFSLSPKEKYMYMWFYDLKSVLETDLSPLLADKSWVGGFGAKYSTAWLDIIYYVQKCERGTRVWFKVRDTTEEKKDGLQCLCIFALVSSPCIIHVRPTNYLGLAPSMTVSPPRPSALYTVHCNQAISTTLAHLFPVEHDRVY